jgi:uncharacterized protein YdhG (YjbR/CyaY superfamily)
VQTIDQYIAAFPPDVRAILKRIRATIRKAAPGAKESISYRIAAFKLDGKPLIYFAAYKSHVGLYPAPRGVPKFKKQLSRYAGGTGTVRFPFDKPIPLDLVARIVKFRIEDNRQKAKATRTVKSKRRTG